MSSPNSPTDTLATRREQLWDAICVHEKEEITPPTVTIPPTPAQPEEERIDVAAILAEVKTTLDMQRFSPEEISQLRAGDFRLFTGDQIRLLGERQIQALTPHQIEHELNAFLIGRLRKRQVRWMTPEQRAALYPRIPAESLPRLFPILPPEECLDAVTRFSTQKMEQAIPKLSFDQANHLKRVVRTRSRLMEDEPLKMFLKQLKPEHVPALFNWDSYQCGASSVLWKFILIHLNEKTFKALTKQSSRENKALIHATIGDIHSGWFTYLAHSERGLVPNELQVKLGERQLLTGKEVKSIHQQAQQSDYFKERLKNAGDKRDHCFNLSQYTNGEEAIIKAEKAEEEAEEKTTNNAATAQELPEEILPEGRSKKEIQRISPRLLATYEREMWTQFVSYEFRHFSAEQIAAIPAEQLAHGLSTAQLDALSAPQVQRLNEAQWQALLPRLTPGALASLIPSANPEFIPGLVDAMSEQQMSTVVPRMTEKQIVTMAPLLLKANLKREPDPKLLLLIRHLPENRVKALFPRNFWRTTDYERRRCGMTPETWEVFLMTLPTDSFRTFFYHLHAENQALAFRLFAEKRIYNLGEFCRDYQELLPEEVLPTLMYGENLIARLEELKELLPDELQEKFARVPELRARIEAELAELPPNEQEPFTSLEQPLNRLLGKRKTLPQPLQERVEELSVILGEITYRREEFEPELKEALKTMLEPTTYQQTRSVAEAFAQAPTYDESARIIQERWLVCARGKNHCQ